MGYIEREKAIRETINSIVEILNIHNSVPLTKIACKMRELPTADVVEVVRCKDCKHFKTDSYYCQKTKQGYCELDDMVKQKQGYCSYGERRCEE